VSLCTYLAGLLLGRRHPVSKKPKTVKREYLNALWEIDIENKTVIGPICTGCKVQMEREQRTNPATMRKIYIYICKNPICKKEVKHLTDLHVKNDNDIKAHNRVLALYESEKRK
jgi:hypothetical protein